MTDRQVRWISFACIVSAWCCALIPVAELSGQDLAPTAQPIVTRIRTLDIPFQLHAAAEQTRELQLLVSRDGGVSWNVEQVALPTEEHFAFAAPDDGEYWFAVRTIDRLGNPQPPGTPKPEARLTVDSTPPRLTLQTQITVTGRINVRWQSEDPRLREGSLRLEYRASGDREWLPFPVEPLSGSAANSTTAGHVEWLPPVDGEWEVRGIVEDTAGNTATVVSQATNAPANASSSAPMHEGQGETGLASVTDPSRQTSLLPTDGRHVTSPYDAGANGLNTSNSALGQQDEIASSRSGHHQPWAPAGAAGAPTSPGGLEQRENSAEFAGANLAASNHSFADRGADMTSRTNAPYRPVGIRETSGDFTDWPRDAAAPSTAIGAESGFHVAVNSLRFAVEFQTPASSVALNAHEAGPREIEVWGTTDGGRTWRRLAKGRTGVGQIVVETPAEGTYGLRLIEIDPAALQFPPRSGEKPELFVDVDLTVPRCQLLNAVQGEGPNADDLSITWAASDEDLAAGSIVLQYGDSTDGPWQTIIHGAENTGTYTWRMNPTTPPLFHLRMLAVDRAGNIGEYVSQVAVQPVRRRGAGRILDVQSLQEEGVNTAGAHVGQDTTDR